MSTVPDRGWTTTGRWCSCLSSNSSRYVCLLMQVAYAVLNTTIILQLTQPVLNRKRFYYLQLWVSSWMISALNIWFYCFLVSALPEAMEINTGSDVGLRCHLHTHDNCGRTVENKGVVLRWVDKRGKELRKDSNRHISPSSECDITISEKIVDPNPSKRQRSWTCQLTVNGQVKASATYNIPIKGGFLTPNHCFLVSCLGNNWIP